MNCPYIKLIAVTYNNNNQEQNEVIMGQLANRRYIIHASQMSSRGGNTNVVAPFRVRRETQAEACAYIETNQDSYLLADSLPCDIKKHSRGAQSKMQVDLPCPYAPTTLLGVVPNVPSITRQQA